MINKSGLDITLQEEITMAQYLQRISNARQNPEPSMLAKAELYGRGEGFEIAAEYAKINNFPFSET